jgi:hypothetical protein
MPRGCWGVLAALAGLILAGANEAPSDSPKSQQPTVEQQGRSDTDHAADTIASAIRETVESAKEDGGCQDRKDKRNSDLCAQWKAADSARDAADYAFFSLLIGIAGAGLLIWTLCETRQTTRRQLRAYLAVKPMGINVLIGSHRAIGQVVLENAGATPAFNVFLEVRMAFGDKDRSDFYVSVDPREIDRTLHPGAPMPMGSGDYLTLSKVNGAGKFIYVWGVAYYSDTFRRRRWTRFCHRYNTGSRDQDAINSALATANRPKEAHIIFSPGKARYHQYGNDAD